jgi:hypothetical protein
METNALSFGGPMKAPDLEARGSQPRDAKPPVQRLLMVADSAVAEVDELPPLARALIAEAAQVYVVTPSLPGRLAWLADDVDQPRHRADERLNTVLRHMRTIGAHVRGGRGDDTMLVAFDDAVAEFQPDHILVGLLSADHANWQERGVIEHVRERFGLPLTSYVIDPQGRVVGPDPDRRDP